MQDLKEDERVPGAPGYYLVVFASGEEIGWWGHTQLDAAIRASKWRDEILKRTRRQQTKEERDAGGPHDPVMQSLLGSPTGDRRW